jgi:hypothetical protein
VQEWSKYLWLFLIRQWRKVATLTHEYDTNPEFAGKVLVVRYEDLVREPRHTAEQMYDFLEIDMDETTLNPGNFVDGSGDQWLQNTSYDGGDTVSFNTDSVRKWQSTLNDRVVSFIEQLCSAEMSLFGYERENEHSVGLADELVLDPPTVPSSELADWISDYYRSQTPTEKRTKLGDELLRQRLFTCDQQLLQQLGDDIRPYVLLREVLADGRAALGRTEGSTTK